MGISNLDKITKYLAPAIRKLEDYQATMTGTEVSLIRIKRETKELFIGNRDRDVFGDFDQRVENMLFEIVDNVIIKYPLNKIEIFGVKEGAAIVTKTINPEEQLPIEFFLKFTGEYNKNAVAITRGDILVDHFRDEHNNVIPIFLEVAQIFGTFFGKDIVRKLGTLVPYRGGFEKDIERKVLEYLNKLVK